MHEIEENFYVDRLNELSSEQIEEILGKPNRKVERTIFWEYWPAEYEPDYSKYFSESELVNGVEIAEMLWEKDNWITIVWLKSDKGKLVAFFSIEYDSEVVQF
jgi:hypothetical protein